MVKVTLTRGQVIALLACLRTAERSADRALQGRWEDLRSFFDSDRRQLIASTVRSIRKEVQGANEADDGGSEGPGRNRLRRARQKLALAIFGRVAVEAPVVSLATKTLADALCLFAKSNRPTDETLIRTRIHLFECQMPVEAIVAASALRMVRKVEHYGSSDTEPYIELERLVSFGST